MSPDEPASDPIGGVLAFDDVVIDLNTFEITRGGVAVSVEPQVFDVLRHLIDHRDRVVTKEDLLDSVWGDRFVSESALTSRIKTARRALGDDGKRQAVIRTIHGRGYRFVAELGSLPAPPVTQQNDRDAMASDGASAHRPAPVPGNVVPGAPAAAAIAAPPKATLGRDDLAERVLGLVESVRLVTLVGPAGVGKTQLARTVGAAATQSFPDGCHFVSLADVRDEALVDQVILDSLGVRRAVGSSSSTALVAELQLTDRLVVLDNCEHLREAVAATVTMLRQANVRTAILATSRRRLGTAGERVIDVPPLTPEVAEALFAERLDDYGVSIDRQGDAVQRICERLDHLPLALELASHQARVLGVERLADLLEESLQFLAAVGESPDDRHQTLHHAISSSYSLLNDELKQALCRLSVFDGAFDLDAAMAVVGVGLEMADVTVVRHIVELAEHSLVVVESQHGRQRYRILEAVREFASERLEARSVVELAHLRHTRAAAEEHAEALRTGDYVDAFHQIDLEWANYRKAMAFAMRSGHLDDASRLANAVVDYADVAQRVEHIDWCEAIAGAADEAPDDIDPQRLTATEQCLARMLVLQDFARADELTAEVDPRSDLSTAVTRSWCAAFVPDADETDRLLQIAFDHVKGTGGLLELYVCALAAFLQKGTSEILALARERTRQIAAGSGDFAGAFCAFVDSVDAFLANDMNRAIDLSDLAIELGTAEGIELVVSGGYRNRARALAGHEDLVMAATHLRDGLRRYRRHGHWTTVVVDGPLAAQLLLGAGRVHAAAQILAAYRAGSFQGSWSTGLADLLHLSIQANHPEEAAASAELAPLGAQSLCDYMLVQLNDIIDSTPEPARS